MVDLVRGAKGFEQLVAVDNLGWQGGLGTHKWVCTLIKKGPRSRSLDVSQNLDFKLIS